MKVLRPHTFRNFECSYREGRLSFTCVTNWPLEQALNLFQHETLEILELHWAQLKDESMPRVVRGRGSTLLKHLILVDRDMYASTLAWMLEFPKGFQYLSTCSSADPDDIVDSELMDHGLYFRAILGSLSRGLQSLRFDMRYRSWVIVPAPGMHKLSSVRYLEVSPVHLILHDFGDGEMPQWQMR